MLVIDDDKIDQLLCERVAKRSGLVGEIRGFFYAEDALEFLRTQDRPLVDVIVLDVNMPRMNGFDFLDAATAEFGDGFAQAVVVMLTTSLDPQDRLRASRFSVVRDYFEKPLTEQHVQQIAGFL